MNTNTLLLLGGAVAAFLYIRSQRPVTPMQINTPSGPVYGGRRTTTGTSNIGAIIDAKIAAAREYEARTGLTAIIG